MRWSRDRSSDVCSSNLVGEEPQGAGAIREGVEDFQDDPFVVMNHTEEQYGPVGVVDVGAGVFSVCHDGIYGGRSVGRYKGNRLCSEVVHTMYAVAVSVQ